jgi:RNA polymerase sigma-70 factor, ECF subfamily
VAVVAFRSRKRRTFTDLVHAIARFDHEAFDGLYVRLSQKLIRRAERDLGDLELARETVADTFAQIWASAARFDAKRGPALQWIKMICNSRILDRQRRLKRQKRAQRRYARLHLFAQPCSEADPADQLQSWQEAQLLQQSIRDLTGSKRVPVILAFYRGLSHIDIAEALNMPLGSVKARIRRALRALKARTLSHFQ